MSLIEQLAKAKWKDLFKVTIISNGFFYWTSFEIGKKSQEQMTISKMTLSSK